METKWADELTTSQLQALTYPLRIKDFTLDDNLPASGFPPDDGHVHESPEFDLGDLDLIPLELLHEVLSELDLRTLTGFLHINRRAVQVVESIPQYRAVATHAPNVLRGVLSIEMGLWMSCKILYEKLCTAECERCGDFSGYLYILTCTRVCFLCLSEDKRYLPLRRSHAIQKFGVNHQILDTLPCLRSVPGIYSPNVKKSRESITLVDHESAYRAGIAHHGSSGVMEQCVLNIATKKLEEFNKRAAQAAAEGTEITTRRPRRPRTEDPFDARSGNPFRFMAIVRMPWLNKVSRELEGGFHCIGCRGRPRRPLHFRRKFTMASFRDHLRECGNIRKGRHCTA